MEKDSTQKALSSFIQETQNIMQHALQQYDANAICTITPSIDIGFPHDVDRIAGGFPTGILVEWKSKEPFIPVDTTVNNCTTSIFEFSDKGSHLLDEKSLKMKLDKINSSSYSINFHRGNHFFCFYTSSDTKHEYLIIHTSAAEFKRQFNGLYPVEGNWYMDDLKVFHHGRRYIRYIIGRKAQLFYQIADSLISFNETRHDFFAEILIGNLPCTYKANHFHHYCMPAHSTILIGSFLLEPETVAPILSRPGKPIFLYKVGNKSKKTCNINDKKFHLLPHGWGKESKIRTDLHINYEEKKFRLNNYNFNIDGISSLRDHPDLRLRDYKFNADSGYEVFQKELTSFCDGKIVDFLFPLISYNKKGFTTWK